MERIKGIMEKIMYGIIALFLIILSIQVAIMASSIIIYIFVLGIFFFVVNEIIKLFKKCSN